MQAERWIHNGLTDAAKTFVQRSALVADSGSLGPDQGRCLAALRWAGGSVRPIQRDVIRCFTTMLKQILIPAKEFRRGGMKKVWGRDVWNSTAHKVGSSFG